MTTPASHYSYVFVPVNARGVGPEYQTSEVTMVRHEVFDHARQVSIAVCPDAEMARHIAALLNAQQLDGGRWRPTHQEAASGRLFRVLLLAADASSVRQPDAPLVVVFDDHERRTFAMRYAQFYDGRFLAMAAPEQEAIRQRNDGERP
jgi:hypothetical protein